MTKEIKAKCKICGEIKISINHFEGYDGEISIPIELCPTLKEVGKYCEDIFGETYEKITGNKIEKSFEKRIVELSHESLDDVGLEEAKKHILEPLECWVEIV